jgi:transcriptional regulator with XRE-family HTH domain
MTDRISLLIKAKNLSAAQFADEIGVQRSSISHLMSGRNKPSLDLIQKTLQRFPEISSEWLLFGKGEMVRELNLFDAQARAEVMPVVADPPTIQNRVTENEILPLNESADQLTGLDATKEEISNVASDDDATLQKSHFQVPEVPNSEQIKPKVGVRHEQPKAAATIKTGKSNAIEQIIILYEDHTFIAYTPGN